MLQINIHDNTPAHMLRAIRAACNELLGETVELRLPTAAVESLADQEQAALGEHSPQTEEIASDVAEPQAEELDSAGQPWNAELHASTKSKNSDGTWKKRRNAGKDSKQEVEEMLAEEHSPAPAMPAAPPLPPAPAAEPIMPKIFALITSQIVTINQAVEAARAEGYADLGANGLGGAPREAQEAVLRKLEG